MQGWSGEGDGVMGVEGGVYLRLILLLISVALQPQLNRVTLKPAALAGAK